MSRPEPPLALLAELTHRCPLRCPYCSNPVELERASGELATGDWRRVFDSAADLGVLQVHFSGGEPTARRDLVDLVAHAAGLGLYGNLITSAVTLDGALVAALAEAGLEHVQISFQDSRSAGADRVAGFAGAYEKKRAAARRVRAAGLALTVNAVMARHNLDRVQEIIDLALDLDAARLEVACVQFYGWGFLNRAALQPTRDQVRQAGATVAAARKRLAGTLAIDFVVPDYYARRPKACMGGWGRRFLNVTPGGRVLPCHAAEIIPGLEFDNVRDKDLAEIWRHGSAFERFRGTAWMPAPCRACERRDIDWGGCRCQAFLLTGEAANTDPACDLSPYHDALAGLATAESAAPAPPFVYRQMGRPAELRGN